MGWFGLLPLVKKLQIHASACDYVASSQKLFGCCTMLQFSTLTNVQELEIEYLNIPNFMPWSRWHFLPTVRSLALREPEGSRRQIIYFIGLFQHLQDLKLVYDQPRSWEPLADDLTLVPLFAPPLRGRLTVVCCVGVGLLKDMIDLFGGIRFRYMNLYRVHGMRLLLDACAETLESVVLSPDPHGKQFSPKGVQVLANDFAAGSSLRDFDLSRNESLRTLQVPASSISHTATQSGGSPGTAPFLKHVLSTITSSAFFEIIVLYEDYDLRCVPEFWRSDWPPRELTQAARAEAASRHRERFEVLREVRKMRDFQLVLHMRVWGRVGEYLVRTLEEAVAEEKAKKGFDKSFPEPSVMYNPQRTCLGRCYGACCV
jgi:hypothetical protein